MPSARQLPMMQTWSLGLRSNFGGSAAFARLAVARSARAARHRRVMVEGLWGARRVPTNYTRAAAGRQEPEKQFTTKGTKDTKIFFVSFVPFVVNGLYTT